MTARYEVHLEEAKRIAAIYDAARGQAEEAEEWVNGILRTWALDGDKYLWRYRLNGQKVLLKVYTWEISLYCDYYPLVTELGDDRLCDCLPDAETLQIRKTLELPALTTFLDLKARLPLAVIDKLRADGVIKDQMAPAYTYASVECPIE